MDNLYYLWQNLWNYSHLDDVYFGLFKNLAVNILIREKTQNIFPLEQNILALCNIP